jgi:hypothetical protein
LFVAALLLFLFHVLSLALLTLLAPGFVAVGGLVGLGSAPPHPPTTRYYWLVGWMVFVFVCFALCFTTLSLFTLAALAFFVCCCFCGSWLRCFWWVGWVGLCPTPPTNQPLLLVVFVFHILKLKVYEVEVCLLN